ncbi:hypothetical protein K5X82_05520 [Halosquirtibacter xylanolyticus]|uniref:hypothetical protein n=1 Tax=Halosquirtibacter xylanolyticus TaxID=3374599 RepID=UPI0037499DEA|nr:hypothetical protein K5X82_05520 [Prolixibacteraceae bacterium]
MTQTVITVLIIAVALFYFIKKSYRNIKRFAMKKKDQKQSACDSCDGCALKNSSNCSE